MSIVMLLLATVGVTHLWAQSGPTQVSGTWQVESRFDEDSRARTMTEDTQLICVFTQTDASLAGRCGGDVYSGVPVSGTVTGSRVAWSFEIALAENAPEHKATFDGSLNEARTVVSGSFAIQDLSGTFVARKQ